MRNRRRTTTRSLPSRCARPGGAAPPQTSSLLPSFNLLPSDGDVCALRARERQKEKQSKSRFSSLRSPLRTPDVGRPARGVARDVATFPTLPPGWVSSFSRLVSALGDRHLMRVTVHKISWKGCLARFSGNVALRVFPGNPTWRKDRGYGILKICLMEKPSFPRRNFVV